VLMYYFTNFMLDEAICFPFSYWDPLKEKFKLKKEEKEEGNKKYNEVFKDEQKMSKVFTDDPKGSPERKKQRLGDHKPEYIKHLSGETEVDYDTLLAFLNALWETQKEAQDDKKSRSKHAMFQVKNCCCGFEIGGRWGPGEFVLKRIPGSANEYEPTWDPGMKNLFFFYLLDVFFSLTIVCSCVFQRMCA